MSDRIDPSAFCSPRETYTMATSSGLVRISVRMELQDVPPQFDAEDAFRERLECAKLLAHFAQLVANSAQAALESGRPPQ